MADGEFWGTLCLCAADLCCAHTSLVGTVQYACGCLAHRSLCCCSRKVLYMSRGTVASAYLGVGRPAIAGYMWLILASDLLATCHSVYSGADSSYKPEKSVRPADKSTANGGTGG